MTRPRVIAGHRPAAPEYIEQPVLFDAPGRQARGPAIGTFDVHFDFGKKEGEEQDRNVSLLNANVGAHLRQLREARMGHWQGRLDVPSHSIVVCAGLGSERDDMLNELQVLALREAHVDARSISAATPSERPGPDKAKLVSAVFVTFPPLAELETWRAAVNELRSGLPDAILLQFCCNSSARHTQNCG